MKITIEIDEEQLDILLRKFEASWISGGSIAGMPVRTDEALTAQLEQAKRWQSDQYSGFAYEIVRMAPVYGQLMKHWSGDTTNEPYTHDLDNLFEFVEALRAGRAG